MSVDRAGKNPLRNQPEMPSYFRKDQAERNKFFSQLGHFGEEHRALFNRLCDMWEPDITCNKFLSKVSHEYLNADTILHTVIMHLERNHYGLISTTVKDGQLEKDRIILVDRDAPRFFYWLVENQWQCCRISDRTKFPVATHFQKWGGVPKNVLTPLSLKEVSRTFIQNHLDEVVIYTLPVLEGENLIVTPVALSIMIEVSRLKIKANLANSPIQPLLAKILGTVVSNMRKSLETNDHIFWKKISEAIFNNREDFLAKRTSINPEIFIAAEIIKSFTTNELIDKNKRLEEDSEKKETIKGILLHLSRKDDFIMSAQEFDKQFEPYRENWPDLKNMFMDHYMKPVGRINLPQVLNIGEDFIFRDHLYPLFKALHKTAGVELKDFYLNLIERILRTNNKDKITVFTSIERFQNDIRELLTAEFQVLSLMLANSQIISEAIIHYATKILKISDMGKVKKMLERYFESGTVRFKNPDILFDLNPEALFAKAFCRLGLIKRIFLRLFGRYDSFLQNFHLSATSKTPQKKGTPRRDPLNDIVNTGMKDAGVALGPKMKSTAKKRKKTGGKKKNYSMKQQEHAWDEFKSAYEKKKS